MALFLLQLRHEFERLWGRRTTQLSFAVCFAVELIFVILVKIGPSRRFLVSIYHSLQLPVGETISGLTEAAYIRTVVVATVGLLFLTLVSADLVAREAGEGTLRMVLARPVSRTRLLLQKLIVCAAYTFVFVTFISLSSLALGLLAEGPGLLFYGSWVEGIVGSFEFAEGLRRYAIASGLLAVSMFTISLLAFTFGCFRTVPAAAAIAALTIIIADNSIRQIPSLIAVRPQFLMSRVVAWLQAYNELIPWGLIRRAYLDLGLLNAALLIVSWAVLTRREFKP